jgi:hypothetical protein
MGVTKFVDKLVGGGTTVERVRVGAAPGLWLSGEPHALYFARPGEPDNVDLDLPLLAGNTLVWERPDGVTVRLEGDLSKRDAFAIAKSLH